MANPTIEELQNPENFELIAELNHHQIKEFVLQQLSKGGIIVKAYMIYQFIMILVGVFFFTHSIVIAFQQNPEPFYYSFGALIFSFSVLIVIHELLHGIAIKLSGAKKVNYGGYVKKFIFYAEADRHVLNRKQFAFIALAPLITVKILTIAGIIIFLNHPIFYALVFMMSAHSLFCAGDIGLLSIFYKNGDSPIYTYDVRAVKTSYYFKKKGTIKSTL